MSTAFQIPAQIGLPSVMPNTQMTHSCSWQAGQTHQNIRPKGKAYYEYKLQRQLKRHSAAAAGVCQPMVGTERPRKASSNVNEHRNASEGSVNVFTVRLPMSGAEFINSRHSSMESSIV
ncbi:hypothetical protein DdX_08335 [Ditylenchus destructor]|uniref:Uncharacterized protein n=1 Tax=Ditylenchus destructor TaxID=166010 RepID=A0AAD4N4X6_9BILA|nr:hypothetical protein DdX_08335 [Ditylenchus destructor]